MPVKPHSETKRRNLAEAYHNPPRVTGGGQRADGGNGTTPQGGMEEGTPPHAKDAKGRFLPGGGGRTVGTVTRKTRMVQERLVQAASKAAQVIINTLDDPNVFARFAASKQVLEAANRWLDIQETRDPAETEWVLYATPQELEQVLAMIDRCNRRRDVERGEDGAVDPGTAIIDVQAEPTLDDLIGTADGPAPGTPDELVIPPQEKPNE